ncbi:MAG TPA: hypothetical protein VGD98_09405 [Ktedonobacteraceae bacterium]
MPMSYSRFEPAAVLGLDGQIYIFGGFGSNISINRNNATLANIEVHNIKSNSWTVKTAQMSMPRFALASVLASAGQVYAIGGYNSNNVPRQVIEAYNPAVNVWGKTPLTGG